MNTEDLEDIEVDATIEKLETVTETIAKLTLKFPRLISHA